MKPANREYTAGLGKLLVKQKQFPSGDRRVNRPGSQVSLLESRLQISLLDTGGGGGTPYIQMIGMVVVFFRGCNPRFGIFRGYSGKIL